MPAPTTRTKQRNRRLTGKIKFHQIDERTGFFTWEERIALMVEWTFEEAQYQAPIPDEQKTWVRKAEWLPAKPLDLASTALRWLTDGRKKNDADVPAQQ